MSCMFLYNSIHPIYVIFITAFIWRASQDVILVALFNLASFAMLPIGFYCNGLMFKYVSMKRLFFGGNLLRALLIVGLVFAPSLNTFGILLFGIVFGWLGGFFWSNRNLLSIKVTNPTNRIYFSTLDYLSQTFNNIAVPVLVGYFIVFGTQHQLYTPIQGYYGVAIVTVILSVAMMLTIKKITVTTPQIAQIIHRHAGDSWNAARGVIVLQGMLGGIFTFLPVILVLTHIGNENALGSLQSIAAVISGLVMYTIARSINTKFRVRMIAIAATLTIIASLILAIFYNTFSIFLFVMTVTVSLQIFNTENFSLIYDLIDKENAVNDRRYSYVFDTELFLNIGRGISITLFLFYIQTTSIDFALRYTTLFISLAVLGMIYLAKIVDSKSPETNDLAPAYSKDS